MPDYKKRFFSVTKVPTTVRASFGAIKTLKQLLLIAEYVRLLFLGSFNFISPVIKDGKVVYSRRY